MTREEREKAIEIIRKYECNAEHYEACEAIIKASEQELCDDAISRQAVIDVVFESRKNFNNEFDQGFFADKIRDLPPVNPQNCDKCEVGNPCLYCRHEFEPQESED